MTAISKPVPRPSEDTAPYWAACDRSEMIYQCCEACGSVQYPPRRICEACRKPELVWKTSKGLGSVYSFTVVNRAPTDAFRADVPYVVALIRFDEGFQLLMQMRDILPDDVEIDQRVRVIYEPRGEGRMIPQAAPA